MNTKYNYNTDTLLRIIQYDDEIWIIPSISSCDDKESETLVKAIIIAARNTASLFHTNVNICMDQSKVFTVHFMKQISTKYQAIVDKWRQIAKEVIPEECFFDKCFKLTPSSLISSDLILDGTFINVFDVLKVKLSHNAQTGILYFIPDHQSVNFAPKTDCKLGFPGPPFHLTLINPPQLLRQMKHLLDSFHVRVYSDSLDTKLFESQIFSLKSRPDDSYVLDSASLQEIISVLLNNASHLHTSTLRIDSFLGVKVYHPGSVLNFLDSETINSSVEIWKQDQSQAPTVSQFQSMIFSGIGSEWSSLPIYEQIQEFIKNKRTCPMPTIEYKKGSPLISVILSAALRSHIYRVIYIPWKLPFESLSRFLVDFGPESFLILDTDFNKFNENYLVTGLQGVMIHSSEEGSELGDCFLNFVTGNN